MTEELLSLTAGTVYQEPTYPWGSAAALLLKRSVEGAVEDEPLNVVADPFNREFFRSTHRVVDSRSGGETSSLKRVHR